MGRPGVPSSSVVEIPPPDDDVRCSRFWREKTVCGPLGAVLETCGEGAWKLGGENGPGAAWNPVAELARRACSFSARSALKKMSNGDSSLGTVGFGKTEGC
jgi:hypothetical protein